MQELFDILIPWWGWFVRRGLWRDKDNGEHDENEQDEQDERAATAAPLTNSSRGHGNFLSSGPRLHRGTIPVWIWQQMYKKESQGSVGNCGLTLNKRVD
jgi:hypothetical protein